MDSHLFVVQVDPVRGDEGSGRSAVPLCVNNLIQDIDGRQSGRAGLHPVFPGESDVQTGVLKLSSELAGPLNCVMQSQWLTLGKHGNRQQRQRCENTTDQTIHPSGPVDHYCLKNV